MDIFVSSIFILVDLFRQAGCVTMINPFGYTNKNLYEYISSSFYFEEDFNRRSSLKDVEAKMGDSLLYSVVF